MRHQVRLKPDATYRNPLAMTVRGVRVQADIHARRGSSLVNAVQQQAATTPMTIVVNWLSAVQK